MRPTIARHTPTLSDKRLTRLIEVDVSLLGHVGDALAILTEEYQWIEIGDPISDITDALRDTLDSYYGEAMVGKIDQFINTPPAAWLEFDGSTYDQADYPELAAVIPASWKSAGDFTLPDLADTFSRFVGSSGTIGATGGANAYALTEAQMPAHTHNYIPPLVDIEVKTVGAPIPYGARMGTATPTTSTGSGDDIDNQPEYIDFILAIYTGRAL